MAISIAYGIGFATVLTLVMLPIFLSFSNGLKVSVKWLKTGNDITKEEVERAIKEKAEEAHLNEGGIPSLNGHEKTTDLQKQSQQELEEIL